jgi:hypothetical protein
MNVENFNLYVVAIDVVAIDDVAIDLFMLRFCVNKIGR